MRMRYTDDPVADYQHYDAELQRRMSKRPKCHYCDEYIQGTRYFDIDGIVLCPDWLNDSYGRDIEDYMDY